MQLLSLPRFLCYRTGVAIVPNLSVIELESPKVNITLIFGQEMMITIHIMSAKLKISLQKPEQIINNTCIKNQSFQKMYFQITYSHLSKMHLYI